MFDDIGSMPVLLPSIEEQKRIVTTLDVMTRRTDEASSKTQGELQLLNEFRTRLIADVVTGKLDVRVAGAGLPDIDRIDDDSVGDSLNQTDTPDLDEKSAVA